jgi:acyl carrier protein
MDRQNIINIVNEFLINEFEIERELIKDSSLLKDELEIESLDLVDIIVMIEKEFKVKVKPEEIVRVKTMHELYDFIEAQIKN